MDQIEITEHYLLALTELRLCGTFDGVGDLASIEIESATPSKDKEI